MLLSSLIISNCEDRVLSLLIHLTGLLCFIFKFFSSYQVLHLFSTEVLFEFVLPCSLFISFQPDWFQFLLVHFARHSQFCKLQGSHGVPCFSFLPESSQFCSTLSYSSFKYSTSQGSLVSLVCQRSNLFYLFLSRFSPVPSQISGRDLL